MGITGKNHSDKEIVPEHKYAILMHFQHGLLKDQIEKAEKSNVPVISNPWAPSAGDIDLIGRL